MSFASVFNLGCGLSRVHCETCGEETLHRHNTCVHCGRERLPRGQVAEKFNGALNKKQKARPTFMVHYRNRLMPIVHLARMTGLPHGLLYLRWKKGDREEQLVRPKQKHALRMEA